MAKTKKGRNLSQEQIKVRVLVYLAGEDKERNSYDIQLHSVSTSQDTTRFRGFLEELCKLGRIEKKDRSDVYKGLVTYRITGKGRETVEKLRDPLVNDLLFFGQEDPFVPKDPFGLKKEENYDTHNTE